MNAVSPIQQVKPAFAFTQSQQQAIEKIDRFLSSDDGMFVLSGFAGTGKTTLMAHLVETWADSMAIAVCAPTHKALAVLREKLPAHSAELMTLHKILGLKLSKQDTGDLRTDPGANCQISHYTLVIVDEASMVSSQLLESVVSFKQQTKILWVGDPEQLPPVNEKTGDTSPVFNVVPSGYRLDEIVRQAADNPIIRLSLAIREADERLQRVTPQILLDTLQQGDTKACVRPGYADTLVNWALYERQEGRDARILAWRNKTVETCNQWMHRELYPGDERPYCDGERLIIQEPHANGRLQNNQEVLIRRAVEQCHPKYPDIRALQVTLEDDDGEQVDGFIPWDAKQFERLISQGFGEIKRMKYSKEADHYQITKKSRALWAMREAFIHVKHEYAMTVHKSQGSTFDTALVDFKDISRMSSTHEFNRCLYVAATRPAQFLAIIV